MVDGISQNGHGSMTAVNRRIRDVVQLLTAELQHPVLRAGKGATVKKEDVGRAIPDG